MDYFLYMQVQLDLLILRLLQLKKHNSPSPNGNYGLTVIVFYMNSRYFSIALLT